MILRLMKRLFTQWQNEMQKGRGWNALFFNNHDQPRALSRFTDDKVYRVESAKLLATTLHGLQGTPYVYQGKKSVCQIRYGIVSMSSVISSH